MAGGISRVHGALNSPQNFAGVSLADFTLTVGGTAATLGTAIVADQATSDGALDRIFRSALPQIASISRVGTVSTSTTQFTLRFAVEQLGADATSSGYLGTGNDNAGTNGSGATTALALQAVVRALGTVNSINLSTATVVAFTY